MLNPLSNPSYLLPPLIAAAVPLALIAVVCRWTRRRFADLLFCGMLLSVSVWALFIFGMRSSPDVESALRWDRPLVVLAYSTYLLYYHFTLAHTDHRGQRLLLVGAYVLLLVMIGLTPTGLLIAGMRSETYGYAPVPGPLAIPLGVTGPLMMWIGAYNLFRRYRASPSDEERNRLLYLLLAIAFPLAGAFVDGFTDLPPVGIWSNLVFCILCSIAIIKYHLLDIRILIRKSLVYLFVSAGVAAPYVLSVYVLQNSVRLGRASLWVHGVIVLFLAILLQPLYGRIQQMVDRLFYRERYDYFKALEQFSLEFQSVTDVSNLSASLVRLVCGALRTASACLLLPQESYQGLVVVSSVGLDDVPAGVALRERSLLVKWLTERGELLSVEELRVIPELQSLALVETQNLQRLRAQLFVPIRTRDGGMAALLVLGEKLSQKAYSIEDKRLLSALATQVATTLENARLFNDAVRVRANLEAWFHAMADGVMIIDSVYKVRYANRAFAGMFGDCMGQVCWEALGREDQCRHCGMRYLRDEGGKLVHYSDSLAERDYDVVSASLPSPDGTFAVIEVFRDVTTERAALERLHESSRLASVGRLAAGVAHEINNPLTGILGFAERAIRKDPPPELRRDLDIIYDEARRAAEVVKNLLTFARRHEPTRQSVDLNDILEKTLQLRAYELKTSNIEVVTDFAPNLPRTLADYYQMQQVFLNIVLNAEQAMAEAHGRGKLMVKTEEMRAHIKVSIVDDGPGIPKENLSKIFEPFFTTKEVGSGAGLGLSICHGIVTEHGGKISATSKIGQGTAVVVELLAMGDDRIPDLQDMADGVYKGQDSLEGALPRMR